jgi:hypothetical protein
MSRPTSPRSSLARPSRRRALLSLGAAALALPFYELARPSRSRAAGATAKRVIFFYFPDGVPGPSQNGEPSKWHATGGETDFQLPIVLEPLASHAADCVFLNGLSLGPTDAGSHPGGAKKLLTATDGGNGPSIDQVLAKSVGASAPWQHLLLGAQSTADNASGDKHVSYVAAGQSLVPQDDPKAAFELLFGGVPRSPRAPGEPSAADPVEVSVIDGVLDDMHRLRAELGNVEGPKLDLHLEALREVEKRIKGEGTGALPSASCESPSLDTSGIVPGSLQDPALFPTILRAQLDLMVLAMACGLTKVGTIQASHHTSELLMSRFPGTEMYDPSFDMRSHQASHYGASHDFAKREFDAFVKHGRYWVSQLSYLLDQLASRPEGDGTMLDHSLVLLCTEVCDGNTHLHDDMPFVLAGRAGGRVSTGRKLDFAGRRHADLLLSIAHAMGHELGSFGDASQGVLPGLLS